MPAGRRKLAVARRSQVTDATAWTLGFLILLFAYIAQARTVPTISEGASQALQGWDMLHGNILLHGWSLSDVSFWTTELPEYALVELVHGLNANAVPIAAALSYALQVLLAGLLAKGRATGREGWVRLAIAVGIMLAPPLGAPSSLLLSSPDHVGTHAPLLLIWLVLDRAPRRWWTPVVVTAMLAWLQIADMLALFEAALPLAVVSALYVYRRRGKLSANWYDLSMAGGALVSAGIAKVVLKVVGHLGGFYVRSPIAMFAKPLQVGHELWPKIGNVLLVFGADFFGQKVGRESLIAVLHLVAVILVVWALAHAIRRFYIDDDLIAQMAVVAMLVVLAAYIFGTKPDSNEVVGLLPIGAVLAGRLLGARIVSLRLEPALAVVLVLYAGLLVHNATRPPILNPNQQVAAWLEQRNLTYGLAGFWNASSVSLETGNKVKVRPVRTYRDQVVYTNVESNSTWYDPKQHYANFVIWTGPSKHCGDLCLTRNGLWTMFGPPAWTERVGPYTVLVYHKNLLDSVHQRIWCGGAWAWNSKKAPSRKPC